MLSKFSMGRMPAGGILLLLLLLAVSAAAGTSAAAVVPDGSVKGASVQGKEGCRSTDYDVCVVGAGGSGMYSAYRLATAKSLSVLVLETDDHVGGHCNTFYYPYGPVNIPVETGVSVFINTSLVRQTLQQLNIAAVPSGEQAA